MLGYQLLNDKQRRKCAALAARAGLSLLDATYIWLSIAGELYLRLPTGVDVIVGEQAA
jgi:hypothetical protein